MKTCIFESLSLDKKSTVSKTSRNVNDSPIPINPPIDSNQININNSFSECHNDDDTGNKFDGDDESNEDMKEIYETPETNEILNLKKELKQREKNNIIQKKEDTEIFNVSQIDIKDKSFISEISEFEFLNAMEEHKQKEKNNVEQKKETSVEQKKEDSVKQKKKPMLNKKKKISAKQKKKGTKKKKCQSEKNRKYTNKIKKHLWSTLNKVIIEEKMAYNTLDNNALYEKGKNLNTQEFQDIFHEDVVGMFIKSVYNRKIINSISDNNDNVITCLLKIKFRTYVEILNETKKNNEQGLYDIVYKILSKENTYNFEEETKSKMTEYIMDYFCPFNKISAKELDRYYNHIITYKSH